MDSICLPLVFDCISGLQYAEMNRQLTKKINKTKKKVKKKAVEKIN